MRSGTNSLPCVGRGLGGNPVARGLGGNPTLPGRTKTSISRGRCTLPTLLLLLSTMLLSLSAIGFRGTLNGNDAESWNALVSVFSPMNNLEKRSSGSRMMLRRRADGS